jgi:hypothetical protein
MLKPMNTERRATTRVAVDLEVLNRADDVMRAKNLSIDGMYIEGPAHPIGALLDLAVHLPGDAMPLRVRGEVVSRGTRKGRMGVRFVGMTTRERTRILDCLFGA